MIVISEQKEGITSIVRIIHNSVGQGKMKKERIRIEREYGEYQEKKVVEDAIRLYYDWGNIDIVKVIVGEDEDDIY